MTLYDELYIGRRSKCDPYKQLLFKLLDDITDRRGLRQEIECMEDDIREEMFQAWLKIITKHLKRGESS